MTRRRAAAFAAGGYSRADGSTTREEKDTRSHGRSQPAKPARTRSRPWKAPNSLPSGFDSRAVEGDRDHARSGPARRIAGCANRRHCGTDRSDVVLRQQIIVVVLFELPNLAAHFLVFLQSMRDFNFPVVTCLTQ